MKKFKVLFLSAANSIHTIRWVNALSKDFEIHLVYCKGQAPTMNKPNENVILHELKNKAPIGYYTNFLELRKLYKELKPDLVNAHYASGYGTLARIAKIGPILLSIWGSDVYEFPNKSKINKLILKKNVNYADYLASTSNVMANELKRQVENLDKEIYITPFGVDINKFKKINLKKENDDFIIGVVKTLEEKYGIEYAILAVRKLKDKMKSVNREEIARKIKFYIYGEGKNKEKLQQLINDNDLQDSVFLKGKISNDEVPKVLNSFDVFCATSISESFGVAIIEAMACELPIVATNADGFVEIMEDNKTGFLVERKNVEEIELALENLLEDYKKRKEFGKNGREQVKEKYDWNKNVNYMKNIYIQIKNNQE